MGKDLIDELRRKAKNGEVLRPDLIKLLRKARMTAINTGDKEGLEIFKGPVEVLADEILSGK
jgi:hypothetical protein